MWVPTPGTQTLSVIGKIREQGKRSCVTIVSPSGGDSGEICPGVKIALIKGTDSIGIELAQRNLEERETAGGQREGSRSPPRIVSSSGMERGNGH